jgi:hypothetical protein
MLLVSPSAYTAELPNERVVSTIANKSAFDRVWYATMQSVISANPGPAKYGSSDPSIRSTCSAGDNGDTYCETSYELHGLGTGASYDDTLSASLTIHSTGKIERSLSGGRMLGYTTVSTGVVTNPESAFLSDEGSLIIRTDKGYKPVREHPGEVLWKSSK